MYPSFRKGKQEQVREENSHILKQKYLDFDMQMRLFLFEVQYSYYNRID